MRIIPVCERYESKIYVIDESNVIYKIDCRCGDFSGSYTPEKVVKGKVIDAKWFPGRRLKNARQFSNKIFYAEPCKHLKPAVEALEKQGYVLKRPKPMTGADKCTPELKKLLIERSNGLCECPIVECRKPGQEVHRKIAGVDGGKYSEDNCVYLNGECHKAITYQPWHSSPGRKIK